MCCSKLKKLLMVLMLCLLALFAAGCSRTERTTGDDIEETPGKKQTSVKPVEEETFHVDGYDYDLRVVYYLNKDLPVLEDAKYNTFDVYKVYKKKEEKVYTFNKKESFDNQEYIMDCDLVEGHKDLGITLVFRLEETMIGLPSILVLSDVDGKFGEVYYGACYGDYRFEDFDRDGSTELLTGASNGGGYVSWWSGFYLAHKLEDGYYSETTYALTKAYYDHLIISAEEAFTDNQNAETLEAYINAYAYAGQEDKVAELLEAYPSLVVKIKISDELPADTYEDYVVNQAHNYRIYWGEIFSGDPDYERDKEKFQGGVSIGDPYIDYIRSSGNNDDIVFEERDDINLDGIEDVIIATGFGDEVTGIYCLKMVGDTVLGVKNDPSKETGYGIYEVRLIKLQDTPQTYLYCGLTNYVNLYGFTVYELVGNEFKQIAYSASPTGAGDDTLTDSDGDGQYDSYTQYRYSYDVLYYDTQRIYVWNGFQFINDVTFVDVYEYPETPEDVVISYISLRVIDDGYSKDIKERLSELCLLSDDDVTLDMSVWYEAAFNAYMGFEDTQVTSEISGQEARVQIVHKDDEGQIYYLDANLIYDDEKWVIDMLAW